MEGTSVTKRTPIVDVFAKQPSPIDRARPLNRMGLPSATRPLPAHPATIQRSRPPHPALVAQRSSLLVETNVQTCVHCQKYLKAAAIVETSRIKATACIFTSSIYLLSKEHRVTDGLDVAVKHLHESVAIAEKLAIKGTTHVIMHVTAKKSKKDDGYSGYEHFHSFIVFDPSEKSLERKYQDCSKAQWAKDTSVATELWGKFSSTVKYAYGDRYDLAIIHEYDTNKVAHPDGMYPVYFAVTFKDGKPVSAAWAFGT